MTQALAAIVKIPTDSPQPTPRPAAKSSGRLRKAPSPGRSRAPAGGTGRAATRGGGEVIELECGITVYPARSEGGRWRAVWYEAGERQQCEAPAQEKLTAKLEKVKIRLEADAPNMRKPGAALIAHYLDPDRLPVQDRWSLSATTGSNTSSPAPTANAMPAPTPASCRPASAGLSALRPADPSASYLCGKQRVVLAAGCGGRGREQVRKDAAASQPSD
jgi:hypothetical protein